MYSMFFSSDSKPWAENKILVRLATASSRKKNKKIKRAD